MQHARPRQKQRQERLILLGSSLAIAVILCCVTALLWEPPAESEVDSHVSNGRAEVERHCQSVILSNSNETLSHPYLLHILYLADYSADLDAPAAFILFHRQALQTVAVKRNSTLGVDLTVKLYCPQYRDCASPLSRERLQRWRRVLPVLQWPSGRMRAEILPSRTRDDAIRSQLALDDWELVMLAEPQGTLSPRWFEWAQLAAANAVRSANIFYPDRQQRPLPDVSDLGPEVAAALAESAKWRRVHSGLPTTAAGLSLVSVGEAATTVQGKIGDVVSTTPSPPPHQRVPLQGVLWFGRFWRQCIGDGTVATRPTEDLLTRCLEKVALPLLAPPAPHRFFLQSVNGMSTSPFPSGESGDEAAFEHSHSNLVSVSLPIVV